MAIVAAHCARIADGSGLSRANAISARQLVRILEVMHRDPELREPFREALAVPGDSGTLKKRMRDLSEVVRAKTGTLSGTSALSGYVRNAGGRWLAFALLFDRCDIGAVRRIQDDFCRAVAKAELD